MTNPDIGSFEEWKKVLLTLPDEIFFGLMRNYLGELKTPFNKHTMIADLLAKFGRPDMQEALEHYLSSEDLAFLTGIASFEQPSPADLQGFLGLGLVETSQKLLNLEERLLVYRLKGSRGQILRLSPLLDHERFRNKLNPARLFAPRPAEALPAKAPLVTEDGLLALLAFLQEKPGLLYKTGAARKKLVTEWESRCPGLASGNGTPAAEILLQTGLGLNLFQVIGESVRFNWPALQDLGTLEPGQTNALLWTAACGFADSNLLRIAPWLKLLLASLPTNLAFSAQSLARWLAHSTPLKDFHENLKLLEGLSQQGVLLKTSQGYLQPNPLAQAGRAAPGPMVIQANFEISLPPGLSLNEGLVLAQAAELRSFDVLQHYEITKASALRSFGLGNTASLLVEILEKLSRKPLPQNLRISLNEWEKEARGVRLVKGVVMLVEESRLFTLEHSPGFERWVLATLAPGVFLVREEGLGPWRKELQQLGLPGLPEPEQFDATSLGGIPWTFARWEIDQPPADLPDQPAADLTGEAPDETVQNRLAELEKALDGMVFNPEERLELRARIRRRVIFDASQLTSAAAKGEKAEAKGLDYLGKIRLIEQALASTGDYLELIQRDEEGQPVPARVRPLKLEKQVKEILLVGENLDTRQPFKAYVSRLGSVKKIRSSLFG